MSGTQLAERQPRTLIEKANIWAEGASDALRRRATKASQEIDRETLRTLLEAYVLTKGERGSDTSPRTLRTYWFGVAKLLEWCEAKGVKPHQIDNDDASRFILSLAELTPKTRMTYLTGVKTLTRALAWKGVPVEGDPWEDIRPRDNRSRTQKIRERLYSLEDINAMLDVADERERAIILLGMEAGLRRREIANLRWDAVDFGRAEITVSNGKGKYTDAVGATPDLLDALKRWREINNSDENVIGVSHQRVYQIVQELAGRADIEFKGVHALRHTCATEIYAETRDPLAVQKHLRHQSSDIWRDYAHLNDQSYRNAVIALNQRRRASQKRN